MILWEMATMTKPFEMMGREQFLKEVVSCWVLGAVAHRPAFEEKKHRKLAELLLLSREMSATFF